MNLFLKKSSLVLILALCFQMILPLSLAATPIAFSVGNGSGEPGETLTVPLTVSNNSGFSGFSFQIIYDTEALTLTEISQGDALGFSADLTTNVSRNIANWAATESTTENGTVLNLTFAIHETADSGEYSVNVQALDLFSVDADGFFSTCQATYTAGTIQVKGGVHEHSFVSGVCSCGLNNNIKIGHTLNLASDISINFAVSASSLKTYDSYYLECLIPQYKGSEQLESTTVRIDPVLTGNYYYFTLLGITAVQMNDMIEATLYMQKGSKTYFSNVDLYSVGTYAYSQLNKAGSSAPLKALCADLLRYGSAAQTFKGHRTDALVDGAMTDAMKACLSDLESVTFANIKDEIKVMDKPLVTLTGRSLTLDSKVTLNYIVNMTNYPLFPEELTLHVSYVNIDGEEQTVVLSNPTVYNASKNQYCFSFDSLLAAELRTVLSASVYEGNTQISNIWRYSIDTYGNGRTDTLLTLCKALMAYSDTALAYFAG